MKPISFHPDVEIDIQHKEKEEEVFILAVMHNSRNPEYWKEHV